MDAEKRQYTLLALPTHLREAGDWSRLNRLLTSFRFLQQKTTVLAMLDHCFLAAMVAHAVERGPEKRSKQPRFPHSGRSATAHGSCPSPSSPPTSDRTQALLVVLETTPPSRRLPLPLSMPHAPRSGESRTTAAMTTRQPTTLEKAL